MSPDSSENESRITQSLQDEGHAFQVDDQVVPDHIGRYKVLRELGRGGFGVVYLADDVRLERKVAIKLPHSSRIREQGDQELYLQEARMVVSLEHPSIAPVYDADVTKDGRLYVVSKFIDGISLAQQIKKGRVSISDAVTIVQTIALALHHSHLKGVFHRDVKPANILLDLDGAAFLSDFGLALRDSQFGHGPSFAGTPAYMSPEQARGEGHRVDGRSDIFSLGVVFYELLTGARPFKADSQDELLDLITHADPRPIRQRDDRVPRELERICHKCIAKRAVDRYTTARDLADDLELHVASQQTETQAEDSAPTNKIANMALTSRETEPVSSVSSGSAGTSEPVHIPVVPRGLRGFESEDGEFFLNLVPGPKDRNGVPEQIRFWLRHLHCREPEETFPVGVLHGPSGSGKSSFARAGILPLVEPEVNVVYIQATVKRTEQRVARRLSGASEEAPNLQQVIGGLRRRTEGHEKTVIIVDQFEQWLQGKSNDDMASLVDAFRQCNGGRVQVLLLVRSDFWIGLTRFFHQLEVPLVENWNSSSIDLFDRRHARRVLTAFGRAHGALPAFPMALNKDQLSFIRDAVNEIAEDGYVIPIRLALLTEMIKAKSWTPETLRESGGAIGIGEAYLEETFYAQRAHPNYRRHVRMAREFLRRLLPHGEIDIKGQSQSASELAGAAGSDSKEEVDAVIQLLDELRLISPTDFESDDERGQEPSYQLTHDYLVPSLRNWLNRKDRETARGRSLLDLRQRAWHWSIRKESRQLPSLFEWLRIRWFTKVNQWSEEEAALMRMATRRHLLRIAVWLSIVLVATFSISRSLSTYSAGKHVETLEAAESDQLVGLLSATGSSNDALLRQIEARLTNRDEQPSETARRNLELSQFYLQGSNPAAAAQRIASLPLDDLDRVWPLISRHPGPLSNSLWKVAETSSPSPLTVLAALALLDPANDQWDNFVTRLQPLLYGLPDQQLSHFKSIAERLWGPLHTTVTQVGGIEGSQAQDVMQVLASTPKQHVDMLVIAEPRLLTGVIGAFDWTNKIIHDELRTRWDESQKSQGGYSARDKARIAIALARFDNWDSALTIFGDRTNPTARSFAIILPSDLQVPLTSLLDQLDVTEADQARQAMILAASRLVATSSSEERKSFTRRLKDLFRYEQTSSLHYAAEFVLRDLGEDKWLAGAKRELSGRIDDDKQWFIDKSGLSFAVLRPGEGAFAMGTPPNDPLFQPDEQQHARVIPRDFAISVTEVPQSLFHRFSEDETTKSQMPATSVTWIQAARFCNWLSSEAKIPPDQWCFEEKEDGSIRFKRGHVNLLGYRLPTEAEWEFACRAGTPSHRFFGDHPQLTPYFAVAFQSKSDPTAPVGSKFPNQWGLFDTLGNAAEWCDGKLWPYQLERPRTIIDFGDPDTRILSSDKRVVRGGSAVTMLPQLLRATIRNSIPVELKSIVGIRPVRTLRTFKANRNAHL